MEDKIKINYPDSEKVYMPGSLYPELRVGMRRVRLTPTVVVKDGEKVLTENPPVYIYDTSGAYSDPSVPIDLRKGLPRLREEWIRKREVERLPGITSEYGRARLADRSLDHLRFEHIQLPLPGQGGVSGDADVLCQTGYHYPGDGVCGYPREHELPRAGHRLLHHAGVRPAGNRRQDGRRCRPTSTIPRPSR